MEKEVKKKENTKAKINNFTNNINFNNFIICNFCFSIFQDFSFSEI